MKGQDSDTAQRPSPPKSQENAFPASFPNEADLSLPDIAGLGSDLGASISQHANSLTSQHANTLTSNDLQQSFFAPPNDLHNEPAKTIPSVPSDSQWDLISLGLEEPLPAPEVIEEL